MNLAERLRYLRKMNNLSQEQLAEAIGVSRQAISKWESEQGKPEFDNIIKLTALYQVSADYIMTGREVKLDIEPKPQKDLNYRAGNTLGIMAIIITCAAATVLLIATLTFLIQYMR